MKQLLSHMLLWLCLAAANAHSAGLSPNVYKRLNDIREQMDAGQQTKSQQRLQALLQEVAGDGYAEAIVRQHLGYSHVESGQWQQARRELLAVVQSQALPDEVNEQVRLLLIQVCLQLAQPRQALQHLQIWLQSSPQPTAEQSALAAQVFHAAGRTEQAIVHLERSLKISERPPESWQRSLVGMYLQTRRYNNARVKLKQLLKTFPNQAEYWRLLANVEQTTGNPRQALQVTATAYKMGLLESRELLNLARQHAAIGMPEKAARLLRTWRSRGQVKTSAKRLREEAELWLLAREQDEALEVLKEAARNSRNGRADQLRGRILFERKRWSEAVSALQTALQRGGLQDAGRTHLLLGIASWQTGQSGLAETQLLLAAQDPSTRKQAQFWLEQLTAE